MKAPTGWAGVALLAPVALAAVFAGRLPLLLLMLGLALLAGGDVFRRARARNATPVALVGLAGIAALLITAHVMGRDAAGALPAIVSATLIAAFIAMLVRRRRGAVTHGLIFTMLAVLVVGVFGSYVLILRAERAGFRLVLGLVIMVIAGELTARVAPLILKRAVSARERLIAGAIGPMLAALALAATLAPPFMLGRAIVLGIVVALAVPAGDLIGEMLEHDLDEEAQRARSPEGILAYVDGLLLAAPVFFYVFRALAR